jgi:hypothetical protein
MDDAFRRGDLTALRDLVDDPKAFPNGPMPMAIGDCLEDPDLETRIDDRESARDLARSSGNAEVIGLFRSHGDPPGRPSTGTE